MHNETTTDTLTIKQLKTLGYVFVAYEIDVETEGHTNIYIRYGVVTPDGKLTARNLHSATDAYNWAGWHFGKANDHDAAAP